MTTLFTFIGESDMTAAGLGARPAREDDPGPIARAVDSHVGAWDEVVLVDDRPDGSRALTFVAWLQALQPGLRLQVSRNPVGNPADFTLVLEAARNAVSTHTGVADGRAYLTTPGTAAMAMAWMYLALQPPTRARLLTAHKDQPCSWLSVTSGDGSRLCVILRGIPGAGKSTLALEWARRAGLEPRDCIFSTDDRFDDDNSGVFDPALLPRMHQSNLTRFIRALGRGLPLVVCDNTNIEPWEFGPYVAAAEAAGYEVRLDLVGDPGDEVFVQSCVSRNRRGLPEQRIRDMARRLREQVDQGQANATGLAGLPQRRESAGG